MKILKKNHSFFLHSAFSEPGKTLILLYRKYPGQYPASDSFVGKYRPHNSFMEHPAVSGLSIVQCPVFYASGIPSVQERHRPILYASHRKGWTDICDAGRTGQHPGSRKYARRLHGGTCFRSCSHLWDQPDCSGISAKAAG